MHEADTQDHHLNIREVDVVFGEDWLLAVSQPVDGGDAMDLTEVRERFRRGRMRHPGEDIGIALWALLDVIVDGYFELSEVVDDRLDHIEDVIFREDAQEATPRRCSSSAGRWCSSAGPRHRSARCWRRCSATRSSGSAPRPRSCCRTSTTTRCASRRSVETQRELLTGLLEAHLAIVSNRMNDVMKKTSSYGAILLVSTLIAGIYGMNFEYMPELDFKYGYFVALAFMAIATVLLWRQFKKKGWL